jgi:hypothetical protein
MQAKAKTKIEAKTEPKSPAADVLTRLFQIVYRSLPVYLEDTQPWLSGDPSQGLALLRRMAADYRALAVRLAEGIHLQGGLVDAGRFPAEFAAMNDLSIGFLLRRVQQQLHRDLEQTRWGVYDLSTTPPMQPLAADVLRTLQEHAAELKEMMQDE